MKNYLIISVLLSVIIFACSDSKLEESNYQQESTGEALRPTKESDWAPLPDSSISVGMVGNVNDTTRMFIKRIEMKFRVNNVFQSSLKIEDWCKKFGGFIILSNMMSNVSYAENKKISEDSLLEITHYFVSNKIQLRVPVEKSDSLIRSIYSLIDFLDYKNISAEDVGLQISFNKRRIQRREKFEQNVRKQVKKPSVSGENIVLGKEDEADNSLFENMRLMDEVKYSTVTLDIYQREQLKYTVIPNNEKNINEYQPGFFKQLIDSVAIGWKILKEFILMIVRLWAVLLMVILVIVGIKKYRKKKSKKGL